MQKKTTYSQSNVHVVSYNDSFKSDYCVKDRADCVNLITEVCMCLSCDMSCAVFRRCYLPVCNVHSINY